MCEAASGFYLNAAEEPRTMYLPASAIAALGRLGFSTDNSQGNFRIDLDLTNPPDFNAIATLMLRALYDAYGARAQTKLGLPCTLCRASRIEMHSRKLAEQATSAINPPMSRRPTYDPRTAAEKAFKAATTKPVEAPPKAPLSPPG